MNHLFKSGFLFRMLLATLLILHNPFTGLAREASHGIPESRFSDHSSGPSVTLAISGSLLTNIAGPDGIVNPGDQVEYLFTVTNSGTTVLTNIFISDPSSIVSGGPIVSLEPGAVNTTTFSALHTITQAEIDAGHFTTTATVTGTPPGGPDVTDSETNIQPILRLSSLDLIKSGTPDFGPDGIAQAGEMIYYFFLVVNTGNVTLTGVTITDPMVTVTGGPIDSLPPDIPVYTTFYASYTLTQADINAGTVVNLATVSGLDPQGNNTWHSDQHIQPLDQVMQIDMEKIGTPDFGPDGIPQAGESISYNFLITNTSNVTLSNVTVTDPLILLNGNPIASMPPGTVDQTTFSGIHVLTQPDIDAGVFTNTAGVTALDPNNVTVSHTDLHTQPLASAPALALAVTGVLVLDAVPPAGIANAGDQVQYTYHLTNTGNTTLSNIQVNDPLAVISGGAIASLVPGSTDSTTLSGLHTLTQADIDAGSYTCAATAHGSPPVGPNVSATAGDTRSIARLASFDLIKSGTPDFGQDGIAQAGEMIYYSFLVVNSGNVSLTGVAITDPLAPVVGGPIDTLPPDIPIYTTFSASYTLTQSDINAGSLTNTATVSGYDPENNLVSHSDDHIQPLDQVMQIDMEKIGVPEFGPDGIPQAGETISYHFFITNTSNVTLNNVMVSDPLIALSGGPIASLLPGASDQTTFSGSHVLTQADIDTGNYTNIATVTAFDPINNPVQHSDRHIQGLAAAPSISLAKTGTLHKDMVLPAGVVNPGDLITYRFVITNTGNTTVSNIVLTDPSATLQGTPVASLAPGSSDSTSYYAFHVVTQADIDGLYFTNVAVATGMPPSGPAVSASDDDIQDLHVAAWTLTKNAAEPYFQAEGDVLHYALDLDNSGNVSISNVLVTDPGADAGSLAYISGDLNADNLLDASETWHYTAVHTISATDLTAGHFLNTASASGTPATGVLESTSASADVAAYSALLSVTGNVAGGATVCYDALQHITVAGNGTSFTVTNGADVTMIAGASITFLPGTSVFSGAHLHGYISNAFCGLKSTAYTAATAGEGNTPEQRTGGAFKLYPNPSAGSFTLEVPAEVSASRVSVEIYGLRGEKLFAGEVQDERAHLFDMPGMPDGMYLVRVMGIDRTHSFKLLIKR